MFSSELFSFEGRASRSKFWLVFLLSIFVSFVVVLFSILAIPALILMGYFSPKIAAITSILLYVFMIPMWWISIATSVKRFHDRNKSGWWYLIVLIPFLGALWLIIENGFLSGTPGANNYGSDQVLVVGQVPVSQVFAPTPAYVVGAISSPITASSGIATWKIVALILVGVVLSISFGVLASVFQGEKSDEANVAQQTPATMTDGNFEVHYNNTNSISTDEVKMKVDISGPTFTDAQLANFRADLVLFYAKYKTKTDSQKNTEPLKTQIGKELDAIFLKDLGVVTKIAAGDLGGSMMLMQPQVAEIMSEVESSSGVQKTSTNPASSVAVSSPATATSPTAKYTVNGASNISVKVGDKISTVWSSTNADDFSTTYSFTGCTDSSRNDTGKDTLTANGSQEITMLDEYLGCTSTLTFTAKNTTTGKQAIATVTIFVK